MTEEQRLKNLVRDAEAAVTTLRSIEDMLQEQVDRLVAGKRPRWWKVASTISDTARLIANDLEASLLDLKLKGGSGK